MRFRNTVLGCAVGAALFLPTAAGAHFQLSYTPSVQIERPGDVPIKLIFWHPFENGHVMDMGRPLDVYAVHRGEKIDLMDTLSPITFQGASNSAAAFEAAVPVRRSGDYVLVTVPAPYYEESEDIYIQQITKAYLNKGTMPTDWAEPQGLKTEIVPLNRPTNVIAGSTFSGIVLSNGEPVAGADIEIEYMAAEPDMDANSTTAPTASPLPGGTVVAMTDADGLFTFGIPKAGFWGFAALGTGPDTQHEGKPLSQDAVIWVRAYDLQ
jgi:cobalt/nickel transport protein